jgi:hypothetical protein
VVALALDPVDRHTLARERDRVGVAELVRREASPDTRLRDEPSEFVSALALDRAVCGLGRR